MRNHTYIMIILVKINLLFSVLELVIEIFDKSKKKRPLFPLENQKGFQLLYNGEGK